MKKVLYVILALVFIYLALCAMGPSNIHVERSMAMNASADVVMGKLSDYNGFKEWSPWQEKDPNMKMTIEGEAGKAGHKYSWEGNKDVGKGNMVISSVTADTLKEVLTFDGKGTSDVYFALKGDGGNTNVTWGMNMSVPFFGRGMMMFFKGKMDNMLGGDFEKGLGNLKKVTETAGAKPAYQVMELNWDERTYYGKKAKIPFNEVNKFYSENIPKLTEELSKKKIEIIGMPSSIFLSWDEATKMTECAPVLCVKNGTELKGWDKFVLPSSKVLKVEYFGAYDKSLPAHQAIDKYIKEKGLTQGYVIEEYANDPYVEKDTAKWQTNIYYLVK